MLHFEKLKVWQKARALNRLVYTITDRFPSTERSNLTAQMRRASVSIVSNICESSGRRGIRDQIRMLNIAMGSARELQGQTICAGDVGVIPQPALGDALEQVRDVQRMLAGLMRYKAQIAARLEALRRSKKESDKE